MLVGMLNTDEQAGAQQPQRGSAASDAAGTGAEEHNATASSISWDTLLDRDRAFELFKQGNPGAASLQETADLLRTRCMEAKSAAQEVGLHSAHALHMHMQSSKGTIAHPLCFCRWLLLRSRCPH